MAFNKTTGITVGADLSCPPPIYRPFVVLQNPSYFVSLYYRHWMNIRWSYVLVHV
jgi:hypothetical protein